METRQILRELDRIAMVKEQIENAAQGLARHMQASIDYIDVLEDAPERQITGEVLSGEYIEDPAQDVEPYWRFEVAEPPIKPGSETVYLDDTVVDPANYEVLPDAIATRVTIPDGSVVTIDYIHRGEKADVVEALENFPELSLSELVVARADYQTAVQWIEQNLLT
jgi:hypothetical protein